MVCGVETVQFFFFFVINWQLVHQLDDFNTIMIQIVALFWLIFFCLLLIVIFVFFLVIVFHVIVILSGVRVYETEAMGNVYGHHYDVDRANASVTMSSMMKTTKNLMSLIDCGVFGHHCGVSHDRVKKSGSGDLIEIDVFVGILIFYGVSVSDPCWLLFFYLASSF